MSEHAAVLAAWENFYVVVGSSGGALIGLQFVVVTLIADRRHYAGPGALHAFGTPTVVHFAGALVLSAIMSAPWPSLSALSIALMTCGLAGLAYGGFIIRLARRQTGYVPVWQDWVWYLTLPSVVYAALTVAAFTLRGDPARSLFGVAASALALLLIGIHNAWDTVTHIVISSASRPPKEDDDHH